MRGPDNDALAGASPRERPSRSRPNWSAVPSSVERDRELFNFRVAYFGRVFFLLSLAFYLRNLLLIALMEGRLPPLGHRSLLLHVAAMAVAGLQWFLCRGAKLSRKAAEIVDAGGLVGAMALYAALTVSEAAGFEHAVAVQSAGAEVMLVALIMVSLVTTHAIIVPGTVQRLFWVSTGTCLLGPLGAYAVALVGYPPDYLEGHRWMPLNEAMYVAMWAIVTIVASTTAARVIHGLKQRVRLANEIGPYTLLEKIGEGGMGVVYLAEHALLRRPTAVKLLPPKRAGERAVHRFEQEVLLTSRLTHPNTIAIFDFGRTPDGVFYYAMEYLDGITLEDLVAHAGPQSPSRVVHLLKQAFGALVEAHHMGLVHRDIKPANLMVCVRGCIPDHLKVLDFGLVKELGTEAAAGLSIAGSVLGTPAYLAPEGIIDPGAIEPRSDVYAVGVVAYQLLVGAPVFDGRTVVEVCVRHLHHEPVAPSARAAQPVPASLDALVLRCLAKRPDERPTAAEAIALLESLADVEPWSPKDALSWWQSDAPRITHQVAAARKWNAPSGPRTIAIDRERRSTRPAEAG